MGYQPGKGLGKNLQGRVEPVEAQFLVEGKGVGKNQFLNREVKYSFK
jgi:hypothetical protein